LGHLLDRFDLEFFRVTLTTHGTSYLGLIMRLGGVYETRGDSTCLVRGDHFGTGHEDLCDLTLRRISAADDQDSGTDTRVTADCRP
ncbi:hypothetical protein, partial [Pseudomonas aeruginosa]|uniref:hypothetical protein n=1 Tax=Pseudomonas aeruginosa TaxID=287 RepID=UPI0029C00AB5